MSGKVKEAALLLVCFCLFGLTSSARLGASLVDGVHHQQVDHQELIPAHQANNGRRVLAVQAKVVGNNGEPTSKFPLGLCEGDCDNDGKLDYYVGCQIIYNGCGLYVLAAGFADA